MGCGFQCTDEEGVSGWLCGDGTCVGGNHVCDGEANCPDGEDELVRNCIYICIPIYLYMPIYIIGKHVCDGEANVPMEPTSW